MSQPLNVERLPRRSCAQAGWALSCQLANPFGVGRFLKKFFNVQGPRSNVQRPMQKS